MMFALRNITFDRVNLFMNDMTSGLPSPLAFLGLASSIAPDVGCDRWAPRVLPVIHEVTPSRGRTRPELSVKSGRFSTVEIMEDMIGTVRISMILDLPGCGDAALVARALTGIRFGGGSLRSHKNIRPFAVPSDGSALFKLPRGYALLPHEDAKNHLVRSGSHNLERLFNALYPCGKASGWRVPIPAGFHLLEDPETVNPRTGTRNDEIPHVFAEPITSIGEFVSIRNRSRLSSLCEAEFTRKLWSWHCTDKAVLAHNQFL